MSLTFCPECAQGEHANCAGKAMDSSGNLVLCLCGHGATYAGTTGHSGTDTSRERAEREVKDGSAQDRAQRVITWIKSRGPLGATVKEVRERFPEWHHGKVSSTLTNLHRSDTLKRLSITRDRCKVYVHPVFVHERRTEEPRTNLSMNERLAQAWDAGFGAGLDWASTPTRQEQDTEDTNPYRTEQP